MPKIALVMWMPHSFAQRIVRGIQHYALRNTNWQLDLRQISNQEVIKRCLAEACPWAGVIGLFTERVERCHDRLKVPVVNVSSASRLAVLPRAAVDNVRIGQMAADHLADHGVRSYVFREAQHDFSKVRGLAFAERFQSNGGVLEKIDWSADELAISQLSGLPKPIGLFAANDDTAFRQIEWCQRLGLRVPEDVSVIGVDNTELICELAQAPLTSIDTNSEAVGDRAAYLLDKLLRGEPVPDTPIHVPPLRVIARESTNVFSVDDPIIAAALRYIHANACSGINVDDVIREVGVSRRTLERQIRSTRGRSPYREIRHVQMKTAHELAAGTDIKIASIAYRCGYGDDLRRFLRHFKEDHGKTPTEVRTTAPRD